MLMTRTVMVSAMTTMMSLILLLLVIMLTMVTDMCFLLNAVTCGTSRRLAGASQALEVGLWHRIRVAFLEFVPQLELDPWLGRDPCSVS